LGEKQREKKEMINQMSDQARFQKLVEERQLSSNERELLRIEMKIEKLVLRNN